MSYEAAGRRRRFRAISLGYFLYTQVAGVIGAIALAAFVSNFHDFDWHSVLRNIANLWSEKARPVVDFFVNLAIVQPAARFLHWKIQLPTAVRDYIGVGIVFWLSTIRGVYATITRPRQMSLLSRIGAYSILALMAFLALIFDILLWPLHLFVLIRFIYRVYFAKDYSGVIRELRRHRDEVADLARELGEADPYEIHEQGVTIAFLTLSPVLYLFLALLLNYALPK